MDSDSGPNGLRGLILLLLRRERHQSLSIGYVNGFEVTANDIDGVR